MSATPTTQALPLPHWETTPEDLKAAVREIKAAIRARIEASGRTVEDVWAVITHQLTERVEEIEAAKARGENVWPVIDYADIEAGTVSPETLAYLKQRGCLIVRGHFAREQALAWDQDIVDYVERNHFFENYRGPGDDFFGSVGSKPEIFPVYWSPAQMQARQSDRMANVQSFLNHLWTYESDGMQWFDPDRDSLYPDRIRRRPPGRELRRPRRAPRPRHARPLDDRGLPAGLPAPLRRLHRAVRPVGRVPPHRRPAVPRHDDVLGLPHLPGLDRAVATWPTTRASCTPSRSPRPWPT